MTIDTAVTTFMQSIQNPILTQFSKFIAVVFDPIVLIIISLIILTYLFIKKEKKQALIFASTILATGAIIKLLKVIIHRARPISSLIQETGFSLPSGHVTMAIVFFGLLIYLFTKKGATLIIIPVIILIAFSRLYLQVHWLTDVLLSFVLGLTILLLSFLIIKFFVSKPN